MGKCNETSLPKKQDLYSHLDIEDITDEDYAQTKSACKYFEIEDLGEYHDHDLYVQSYVLLSADLFENFGNICRKMYKRDAAKFLSAPG